MDQEMDVGCFAVRRLPDGNWIIILPDDSGGCNLWISRIVDISSAVETAAHPKKEYKP